MSDGYSLLSQTEQIDLLIEAAKANWREVECRDAVLAWDGQTFKTHPVTGKLVSDEAAQVPQWRYRGGRRRLGRRLILWWAKAAALVAAGQVQRMGLITTNSLRQTFNRRVVQGALDGALSVGASSTGALASAGTAVAAGDTDAVSAGALASVGGAGAGMGGGLMLSKAQKSAPTHPGPSADTPVGAQTEKTARVQLVFAIPDHPWVDSADGAAVRIAMTVAQQASAKTGSDPNFAQQNLGSDPVFAGSGVGRLLTVTGEQPGPEGEVLVTLTEQRGLIHADLSVGVNTSDLQTLQANKGLACPGVQLSGQGFVLSPAQAASMRLTSSAPLVKRYLTGRDLAQTMRDQFVIDTIGLDCNDLLTRYPDAYQWLYDRVKPERDLNPRETYRRNWWKHAETRTKYRDTLLGLSASSLHREPPDIEPFSSLKPVPYQKLKS